MPFAILNSPTLLFQVQTCPLQYSILPPSCFKFRHVPCNTKFSHPLVSSSDMPFAILNSPTLLFQVVTFLCQFSHPFFSSSDVPSIINSPTHLFQLQTFLLQYSILPPLCFKFRHALLHYSIQPPFRFLPRTPSVTAAWKAVGATTRQGCDVLVLRSVFSLSSTSHPQLHFPVLLLVAISTSCNFFIDTPCAHQRADKYFWMCIYVHLTPCSAFHLGAFRSLLP